MSRVIAVVGPTAAGKSDVAVQIAQAVGGEVVNADSMQLYRGMDVGTAKLSVPERRGVPHHLLDVLDVREPSTAADYQRRAREVIAALQARGVVPVLVGGSGLYLSAALDDLRFPGTDPEVRAALERELAEVGAPALHARLVAVDPQAAARMEPTNGRRVVRALEVAALGGSVAAGMAGGMAAPEPHVDARWIGLDREDLAERIDRRVERMWQDGLVEEVRGLEGLREGVTARQALGYRQVLQLLDGELTEAEAVTAVQSATRRFAKRQRSWFRRDARVTWTTPEGALALARDA